MNSSNDLDDVDDADWARSWDSPMDHNATHRFGNTYLKCSKLGERRDAFYVSVPKTPKTIIMALHIDKSQAGPTPLDGQETIPGGKQSSTVYIVPRLLFPAEEDDRDAYGWGSRTKRDLAATWIEGSLDKLQSENFLTACTAGTSAAGIGKLLKGEIRGFKLSLGSGLRDTAFAPSCSGSPASTFIPDPNTLAISKLAAVTVDGNDFKLALREAANTQTLTEWHDGQLYSTQDLKSLLVPKLDNDAATLKPDAAKALRRAIEKIKSEGATYQYPNLIKQCVFGGVVLWGPDETRTDASSSTAANQSLL